MLQGAVAIERRECPMCTNFMRLVERVQTDRIPGTVEVSTRAVVEWVCPDCDYFEERDDSGDDTPPSKIRS
jgi:C4-type Zn-finger protein